MTSDKAYIEGFNIHKYGSTLRMSADMLLVEQINRVRREFPEYQVALPGTSGVHGETIPLFRTQCRFELADEGAVQLCLKALKERDDVNRRRPVLWWTWEMVWKNNNRILFFVNWLDFAYFFKNRDAFLGAEHARYTKSFDLNPRDIEYVHYRILDDGSQVEFDAKNVTEQEAKVLLEIDEIEFDRPIVA